ncbi:MAG: hypothetical protein Q7K57_52625 [Burkholderiaceae bacterium]|nr:hypothetical protein [Burkholderiaceae bacterium]
MNSTKTFEVGGLLSSMSAQGIQKQLSRLSGVTYNPTPINANRMPATLRKMYQNQWRRGLQRGGLPAGCRRDLPGHDQYGGRCHCHVGQFWAGFHQRTDAQAHATRRHPPGQSQRSGSGYGRPCVRGARR